MTGPGEVNERHDTARNDHDVVLRVGAGDHTTVKTVERVIPGHLGPELGLKRPGVRGAVSATEV